MMWHRDRSSHQRTPTLACDAAAHAGGTQEDREDLAELWVAVAQGGPGEAATNRAHQLAAIVRGRREPLDRVAEAYLRRLNDRRDDFAATAGLRAVYDALALVPRGTHGPWSWQPPEGRRQARNRRRRRARTRIDRPGPPVCGTNPAYGSRSRSRDLASAAIDGQAPPGSRDGERAVPIRTSPKARICMSHSVSRTPSRSEAPLTTSPHS
jgi:hypothetical protein